MSLDSYLGALNLVDEELQMWKASGFYVSCVRVEVAGYSVKGTYVTKDGRQWHIPIEVAMDLRNSVVSWWRHRKTSSFASDIVDELESRHE